MNEKPLISIIIPVYNVEKYLARCLDSVISQSYDNLEIILINDGSTDNSGMICKEYSTKDDRIILVNQNNAGASHSRNVGISMAHGEYIGFVDSDDYIVSTMYERMLLEIEKSNAEVAVCNYQYVSEDGTDLKKASSILRYEIVDQLSYLKRLAEPLSGYYITPWNKLYKKEIIDGISFPEGMTHEDNAVVHRIISKCKKIVIIPDILCNYTQRESSVSRSIKSYRFFDNIIAIANRIRFYNKEGNEYLQLIPGSLEQLSTLYIELRRFYLFHTRKTFYGFSKNYQTRKLVKELVRENRVYCDSNIIKSIYFVDWYILKTILREIVKL